MRQLRPLAIATLLLLCACPQRGPALPPLQPEAADAFSAFGQRISTEDGLRQELKDLQARWTIPPDPTAVSPGDAQERYKLSSFTREQACGVVLAGARPDDRWELTAWDGSGLKTGPVQVVAAEPTPGGYRFVATTGEGGGLTITLNGRWVQGRFLQITREIEVSGGDVALKLPYDTTAWTLSGPSCPLRLLPGESGPYGAVPPAAADGTWRERSYPWDLALPAVAAYRVTGGMLLSPVDEHQRLLTRSYRVGYRIQPVAATAELARVGLEQYDPTADTYGEAYLVSGLPLRESVVAAPLAFNGGTDFRLTLAAIDALADLCHGFIMAPKPRDERGDAGSSSRLAKTCVLEPTDWSNWSPDPPGGVKALLGWRQVAAGIRSESLAGLLDQPFDQYQVTYPDLMVELAGPETATEILVNPFSATTGSMVGRLEGGALLTKPGSTKRNEEWLELRRADVAAWVLRTLDGVGGCWMARQGVEDWWSAPLPPPQPGQFAGSWTAAACALELSQAAGQAETLPLMAGLPRACRPAYAPAAVLDAGAGSVGRATAARCKAYLAWAVFGVDAYLRGAEDNLASLLLACGAGASGVVLTESVMACPGGESFCAALDDLANRVGELTLHLPTAPAEAGADHQACVMFPADLTGETTLWLAFLGVDGSVSVDEHNLMTVTYGDDSFSLTLPAGFWKPQHPDPLNVGAGDVVIVSKSFISAPDTNPSSDDTI